MSGTTQRDARHVGRAGKREVCARWGELVSRPRRRGRTGSQLPRERVHSRARAQAASIAAIKHRRDKKERREGGKNKTATDVGEKKRTGCVMCRQGGKCSIDSVGCVWMWGEEKKSKVGVLTCRFEEWDALKTSLFVERCCNQRSNNTKNTCLLSHEKKKNLMEVGFTGSCLVPTTKVHPKPWFHLQQWIYGKFKWPQDIIATTSFWTKSKPTSQNNTVTCVCTWDKNIFSYALQHFFFSNPTGTVVVLSISVLGAVQLILKKSDVSKLSASNMKLSKWTLGESTCQSHCRHVNHNVANSSVRIVHAVLKVLLVIILW